MAALPPARRSAAWHRLFPIEYRFIRILDPLVRRWWRVAGLGNVVELRVAGRRTGLTRSVLLGLLRDGDRWFLGHPNGDVGWTRNLEAANSAEVAFHGGGALRVRATRLNASELRDRAIAATQQHVFPGNLVYRLAWSHIRAVGAYFLIEPAEGRPAGEGLLADEGLLAGASTEPAVPTTSVLYAAIGLASIVVAFAVIDRRRP